MDNKNQKEFESECKKIHDSLQTQNYSMTQLLAHINKHERKQLKVTYMRMYNEDLVTSLRNAAVSPNLCSALAMWMLCPLERNAVLLREALDDKQREVNYKALVEIFVGTKSSYIAMIKQIYYEKFRRYLDQDVSCIEPPHSYQKILIALGASHKAHHADVSQHIAKCDAMRLYQTGEGNNSPGATDEAVVLEIFSKRSISQLKLTFSSYKCIYGHNYTKALKKGNCREFENSLRVVVKCIYNPPKYYAKALYVSLNMNIADKCDVARMIMSQTEIDINEIAKAFKNKYEMKLGDAISDSIETKDYRDFLVALTTNSANVISPL